MRIVGISYPRLANLGRVQGKVELLATISADGGVREVLAVSGHQLLVEAPRQAVLQWRFACDDSDKVCHARASFDFQLLDEECKSSCCPAEFRVDLPSYVVVRATQIHASID